MIYNFIHRGHSFTDTLLAFQDCARLLNEKTSYDIWRWTRRGLNAFRSVLGVEKSRDKGRHFSGLTCLLFSISAGYLPDKSTGLLRLWGPAGRLSAVKCPMMSLSTVGRRGRAGPHSHGDHWRLHSQKSVGRARSISRWSTRCVLVSIGLLLINKAWHRV